jgi:3-deoxy-D-manno-octulosonate 8-phosphate phosphatase (KDO 8-P phosphatase)
MGDGIFDHIVFKKVAYAIAPANADPLAKQHAHYVTQRAGAERAVAEACRHISEHFFQQYESTELSAISIPSTGPWGQ